MKKKKIKQDTIVNCKISFLNVRYTVTQSDKKLMIAAALLVPYAIYHI